MNGCNRFYSLVPLYHLMLCLSHAPSFPFSGEGPSWGKHTSNPCQHQHTHISLKRCGHVEERSVDVHVPAAHWEAELFSTYWTIFFYVFLLCALTILSNHRMDGWSEKLSNFCTSPTLHPTNSLFFFLYDITHCKKCHPKNQANVQNSGQRVSNSHLFGYSVLMHVKRRRTWQEVKIMFLLLL